MFLWSLRCFRLGACITGGEYVRNLIKVGQATRVHPWLHLLKRWESVPVLRLGGSLLETSIPWGWLWGWCTIVWSWGESPPQNRRGSDDSSHVGSVWRALVAGYKQVCLLGLLMRIILSYHFRCLGLLMRIFLSFHFRYLQVSFILILPVPSISWKSVSPVSITLSITRGSGSLWPVCISRSFQVLFW